MSSIATTKTKLNHTRKNTSFKHRRNKVTVNCRGKRTACSQWIVVITILQVDKVLILGIIKKITDRNSPHDACFDASDITRCSFSMTDRRSCLLSQCRVSDIRIDPAKPHSSTSIYFGLARQPAVRQAVDTTSLAYVYTHCVSKRRHSIFEIPLSDVIRFC